MDLKEKLKAEKSRPKKERIVSLNAKVHGPILEQIGAGIQADLKMFSALGCYGMTVLTALPIQNTRGVQSIYSISDLGRR